MGTNPQALRPSRFPWERGGAQPGSTRGAPVLQELPAEPRRAALLLSSDCAGHRAGRAFPNLTPALLCLRHVPDSCSSEQPLPRVLGTPRAERRHSCPGGCSLCRAPEPKIQPQVPGQGRGTGSLGCLGRARGAHHGELLMLLGQGRVK